MGGELHRNVRWNISIKIVGTIAGMIGLFMLIPAGFSLFYGEDDFIPILSSAGICILIGLLSNLQKKINRSDISFHKRNGYIVVALSWVAISTFGALPLFLHGSIDNFTDAFFESMSGFTTTGSTILTDIEVLPKGLLVWRSLTQWIGGLGIIMFSIALLPTMGIGGNQLFAAEFTGPIKDKLAPKLSNTAKILFLVYLGLTILELFFLMCFGMNFFDAFCHSLTTVSTGGFSTKNESIAYFSPQIQYVITVFMFLAGINFALYYFALRGKFEKIGRNEELKAYTLWVLFAIAAIFVLLTISNPMPLKDNFRHAAFQVVSFITTTGYVSIEYGEWIPPISFLLLLMMFSGACAGSTTGAMKVSRIVLLLKNSLIEFKRAVHPRAIMPVKYDGKVVRPEVITQVLAFFFLYIGVFIVGSIGMSLMGFDTETAMSLTATSLGNVGPGIGKFCGMCNFSEIPTLAKWLMSFFMLIGRLEVFTILILFVPSFWKK